MFASPVVYRSRLAPGSLSFFRRSGLAVMLSLGVFAAPAQASSPVASGQTPVGAAATAPMIYTVSRQQIPVSIAIAGTVAAAKTVDLSAQAPGRVLAIQGKEGDQVKAGQVLLRLDDAAMQAKLKAAHAARAAALANVRNTQVQLHREINSPRSGAGSAPGGMGMPAMMDQAFVNPMQSMMGMRDNRAERYSDVVGRETAVAQAQTRVATADAQIREIEAGLRDIKSIAPFDGVIDKIHVEVGDTVQPGSPLLRLSGASGLQVLVDVPLRVRAGLSLGMKLGVMLDAHKVPLRAVITNIFPSADPRDHTVRVELNLPEGSGAQPGMYAAVAVPRPQRSGTPSLPLIPRTAVTQRGGLPLVYAVTSDNTVKLRIVRLGRVIDANHIAVLSGLQEGDRIISNPPPGLRAGDLIPAGMQ